MGLTIILTLCLGLPADPPTFDDALRAVAEYRFGDSMEPLRVVSRELRVQGTDASARAALEERLLAVLRGQSTTDGQGFILRELSWIGSDACVSTVATFVNRAGVSGTGLGDLAIRTLQRIDGDAAGRALREALPAATGDSRLAIVHALGERRDEAARSLLEEELSLDDAARVSAAAIALGQLAEPGVAENLADRRRRETRPGVRAALVEGMLRCAETRGGAEAEGIYESLMGAESPRESQVAAVQGLVRLRGEGALPLLLELLARDDAGWQAQAAVHAERLPGDDTTRRLAEALPSLRPAGQVALLGTLARRGDNAAVQAVASRTRSEHAAVAAAALDALGQLGDERHVSLLVAAAAQPQRENQGRARRSLLRLRGAKVDAALVRGLSASDPAYRVESIRALEGRSAGHEKAAFFRATEDPDPRVRVQALRALEAFAAAEDVEPLLARVLAADNKRERQAAEDAVVAAASLRPEGSDRVAPVVKAWRAEPTGARVGLLVVMRRLGGDEALAETRTAATSEHVDVREPAIRSLSRWPDPDVIPDLMTLAARSESKKEQALALRGAIRLLGEPSPRSFRDTAKLYRRAFEIASTANERRSVMAGLGAVVHEDALALASSQLETELKVEAALAVVSIARGLSGSDREGCEAAIRNAVETANDERVREQGDRALAFIAAATGAVRVWQLSGPYPESGPPPGDLFVTAFPPEKSVPGVRWRPIVTGSDPKRPEFLDLAQRVGGNQRVVYLRTVLRVPRPTAARLDLGSDDGVKVWLNGVLVHENDVGRGYGRGDDQVPVALNEGANVLLVKITQGGGGWGAGCLVRSADGSELPDLEIGVE